MAKQVRITGPTLKALAMFLELHPKQLSGADIMNEKKILSGTLYPMLDRLEAAGWLESEWEKIDPAKAKRPRKRLYHLTAYGVAQAKREILTLGFQPSPKKATQRWAPKEARSRS